MTGIPVKTFAKSELKLLRNLEKHLAKFIIGCKTGGRKSGARHASQSQRCHQTASDNWFVLCSWDQRAWVKTELTKVLAREVFGSEEALVKIDMSGW